ncbi:9546_t:CDS:2 [Ambispora leptoticha]|uniref:9546_t:CDS:1 n=1 Tax=Ambispora leptoticha TaxID=144679 RepID=A0A9N8ZAF4_9GLOM|nr:9546_t:CDS:2 [Ambispora leptoticha]
METDLYDSTSSPDISEETASAAIIDSTDNSWYLENKVQKAKRKLTFDQKAHIEKQYSVFQCNYKQGGLAAPILKDMLDARLLTILLKLLTSNTFWATTERENIDTKLHNKRKIFTATALSQNPCLYYSMEKI